MAEKFKNLQKELSDLEKESGKDPLLQRSSGTSENGTASTLTRYILFTAFVVTFLFYLGSRYDFTISNPFQSMIEQINQPNEALLTGMANRMEEMGYTGLSREDLIELRNQGVTATYISRLRDIGFTELTTEDAVKLQQAGITTTFLSMMQELGYDLTIDEFVRLRRNGVTAFFTSNIHDRGFRDVTPDQLIRLVDIGVTTQLIDRLTGENPDITLDEIIRYRISNQ
jgi:hypothetical protein